MNTVAENTTPRVVVVGLASCFGCQLQITNIEPYLLDLLGQIDLRYWQLASSDHMPDEFDVAVIEGAVTTAEAVKQLEEVRAKAKVVITIGACAVTAGIPGMAAPAFEGKSDAVYGADAPAACGEMISPVPVSSVIKVDHEVRCCPIDPQDFLVILQRVLRGSNRFQPTSTLCGECKLNERGCFFGRGKMCLGLITRAGCGAKCPNLDRPCNGCAGLSPDANLTSARYICEKADIPVWRFDKALEMFNQVELTKAEEQAAGEAARG